MPTVRKLVFTETTEAQGDLITKFGGQPSWLSAPVAPLSRRTQLPMTFICQIVVPHDWCTDGFLRMAYVFMTGAGFDHRAMETWSPSEGETCVVIQTSEGRQRPHDIYPDTLKMWQERNEQRMEVPCEFFAIEEVADEAAYVSQDELDQLSDAQRSVISESWRGNKIGGSPYWIQYEEFPFDDWRLLLQLEDGMFPFNLNLGTGVGYVFLNSFCTEGRLLWQC